MAAISVSYAFAAFTTCLLTLMISGLVWRSGTVLQYSPDDVWLLLPGTVIAGVYGAPLAIPLIVAAQFLETKRWTIFTLGGAIVGAFMFIFMEFYPLAQRSPGISMLVILIVAASFGGLAYNFLERRLQQMRRFV